MGVEKESEREESKGGGKLENFLCAVHGFLMDADLDVTNFNFSDYSSSSSANVSRLLISKLRPMTSIGRPEASNTRGPS